MAWREQQGAGRLQRCLPPPQVDVFRVPWEDLIYPPLTSLPPTLEDRKASRGGDGGAVLDASVGESDSSPLGVKLLPFSEKGERSGSSEDEDSEGEYVELSELPSFSPQKGSLTQSISLQVKGRSSTAPPHQTPARKAPPEPAHLHSSGATPAPWTASPPSASPPAPSSCGGQMCTLATDPGGEDPAWKETIEEPVEAREMDEEQPAEEVEVEEEVHIRIQQNQEQLQEEEEKAEVQTEAGVQEVGSHRSVCEEKPGEGDSEDRLLAPPAAGSEEVEEEEVEREEGADGTGAPAFTTQAPSLTTAPSLAAAEAAQSTQSAQSAQQSSFYRLLLRSGAVCLPGSRDRGGRALLTVSAGSSVWSHPDRHHVEVLRLLLYYRGLLREEVQAWGLTVLVDARGTTPLPVLFSALRSLQKTTPGSVHRVLLLVDKDLSLHVDKPAGTQVEVLRSLQALHTHVALQRVPAQLGGSLTFSQNSWLCFRWRVEQLSCQCESVIRLLQETISTLQATPLPAQAQDAELLLSRTRMVMQSVLEEQRLLQLQQEGGASLAWLRSAAAGEEQRGALERVSTLYNQVDELLHSLVALSNRRSQELSFIQDFSRLEQHFTEVTLWLQQVGEVQLQAFEDHEDSLELLIKKQDNFKEFYTAAFRQCSRAEEVLRSLDRWSHLSTAGLRGHQLQVQDFWSRLQDFSHRVRSTGAKIHRSVRLYRFLDQAYGWALEGLRLLSAVTMEECSLPGRCQAAIGSLEEYHRQHPAIPDSLFQEMRVEAEELRGEQGLQQWTFAWSKCEETQKVFVRKVEAAVRTQQSASRRRSTSALSRKTVAQLWGGPDSCCSPEENRSATTAPPSSLIHSTSTPALASSSLPPEPPPLLQHLFRSSSREEKVDVCSSVSSLTHLNSPSSCSSSSSSRRPLLRKTQSLDCPSPPQGVSCRPFPRPVSGPVPRGHTGVLIRGLEVSSTEVTERTLSPRRSTPPGCSGAPSSSPAAPQHRGGKLRHIVEEMVTTEREYVRSLRYVIHHYLPEMERADLPQDLRGKRSLLFGNLEKLLEFHSHYFLKELEACWKHPLRAPDCFLRHQEQFGLYALYSKNKPRSDALLSSHGTEFFRRKQMELGDKMDLSSYLLKPVQRMSKYALLLTDLMKEVSSSEEAELSTLQDATSMVKFQLRHGNDLLAMDAIRDCDVNLKEQGQLIRQDEFTVWTGRRKCQRHVFLFEELVLFSKPKKMEAALAVFIYKQSFKMADVGLTETTGTNGLQFEIWFRRRRSKSNTVILQALTEEVKNAWTADISRILWAQASRNKELRLKELLSMGVGSKPFLDIQPSEAAISDRAVPCFMKSRGARTRASIAVPPFHHSLSSGSAPSPLSSSSLLGPLNLHTYSRSVSSADSSFIASFAAEDEQEHETSSQPSMTTESSGSSRCLSGSTGSDSGCVSSHLREVPHDEPSPPRQHPCCSCSRKHHLSDQSSSPTAASMTSPASVL